MLYLFNLFELYDFKNCKIFLGEIVCILVFEFFMLLNIYIGDFMIFILRFLRVFDKNFECFDV